MYIGKFQNSNNSNVFYTLGPTKPPKSAQQYPKICSNQQV